MPRAIHDNAHNGQYIYENESVAPQGSEVDTLVTIRKHLVKDFWKKHKFNMHSATWPQARTAEIGRKKAQEAQKQQFRHFLRLLRFFAANHLFCPAQRDEIFAGKQDSKG